MAIKAANPETWIWLDRMRYKDNDKWVVFLCCFFKDSEIIEIETMKKQQHVVKDEKVQWAGIKALVCK